MTEVMVDVSRVVSPEFMANLNLPPNTSEAPKVRDLKDIADTALSGEGLKPVEILDLVERIPDQADPVKLHDKIIPVALAIGSAVAWVATKRYPGMPSPVLSNDLHEFLQWSWNKTVNSAKSPKLSDHATHLLAYGAALYAGAKTLFSSIRSRTIFKSVRQAHDRVAAEVEAGSMTYKMNEGHTALFAGNGDPLADAFAAISEPGDVMIYSTTKPPVPLKRKLAFWKQSTPNEAPENRFVTYEQGGLDSAGEGVLLPVVSEDMFLPDPKVGHDMGLDSIDSQIGSIDTYCKERNIPLKRILIVASEHMEQGYSLSTPGRKIKRNIKTLAAKCKELSEARGVEVKIIDPTKLVIEKLETIANGGVMSLYGTDESVERYDPKFQAAVRAHRSSEEGIKQLADQKGKKRNITVYYNILDIQTEVNVSSDGIAVILDPNMRQALINRGVLEENIIVVPELVIVKMLDEAQGS